MTLIELPPVRVFIGSGEASLLERKTLIHSLRRHSDRQLEIFVFNGSHNSIETLDGAEPQPAPMSLKLKYANVTEFSNYRFLIPELCNHQGRAIWLDSDMVALSDIGELFDFEMHDASFLAKAEAYGNVQDRRWGLSVMLIDCAKTRFNLEQYVDEIESGEYSFTDLHQMTPRFQRLHSFEIGDLDPNWNVFDRHDAQTKLIHYTNLLTQPWKFPRHKYENLWFQYFEAARQNKIVTDRDIELSLLRGYVRRDITRPNHIRRSFAQRAFGKMKRLMGVG